MIRWGIIIAFIFFSCTQSVKVPDNVLPPEKMEKVLLDMLRAEEFYNHKQGDSSTIDSFSRINLYQAVLESHKTNKENFKRSFTFYEQNPELLKKVLDAMHTEANKSPVSKPKPTPGKTPITK